ncbi:MAG: TonB family protein [Pseudobdellovibrionaceae bacterium]
MTNLEQTPPDEQISRGIAVSIAIHAFLISFFALKAVFYNSEPIDFSQAVRVDIVGLPEKIDANKLLPPTPEEAKPELPSKEKPQPPTAQKAEPVKVEPKKPEPKVIVKTPTKKVEDGINLEKVKSKQQTAIDKLKSLAAIEKIKDEVVHEKKASAAGKANNGGPKVKGNILSAGTALTGLSKLQHDSYASDLDHHIKQNWALPEWLAKRNLKAQARVFIDSRGNIIDRKIIKSSGNPSYDEEVLATIDRSSPFPSPPEKFVSIVSVDGILIGFPE